LREARVLAAEEGLSASALLAAKLDEIGRQRRGFDRARKRAVARLRKGLDLGWTACVRATSFRSDKVFVDTNVLLYARDRSTSAKVERARSLIEKLWESGGGVLSTQVIQELYVNLRRKTAHPQSMEQTCGLLQDYLSWEVVIHTAESVIEALAIEQHYNLSFWDALTIQAAGSAGVSIVDSEDMADGQRHGPLRVVNRLNQPASD
jgi:predicted nucleic acid-binding protein